MQKLKSDNDSLEPCGTSVLTFLDVDFTPRSKFGLVFLSDNMTAIALWLGGAVIC